MAAYTLVEANYEHVSPSHRRHALCDDRLARHFDCAYVARAEPPEMLAGGATVRTFIGRRAGESKSAERVDAASSADRVRRA
jgi:hypothetical protein